MSIDQFYYENSLFEIYIIRRFFLNFVIKNVILLS